MSDSTFWGLTIVGSLTAWLAVSLLIAWAWARIHRPPRPTLADRMTAARDWTPAAVDAAFAEIVKEAGR